MDEGLTKRDVYRVVNKWIGVQGGYLGDFSYRTHYEFYLEYCNLDINPHEYEGTTRERFIAILSSADPRTQAIILEGVLERFPAGSTDIRTPEMEGEIWEMIRRCRSAAPVATPDLGVTSEAVERAIADAEILIHTSDATSAIDRLHTALHGYLSGVLEDAQIGHDRDVPVTALFKQLCRDHPAFSDSGSHREFVLRILRSLGAIVEATNTLRNQASLAHPSEELLPAPEADLFVNATRTLLHYVSGKVGK